MGGVCRHRIGHDNITKFCFLKEAFRLGQSGIVFGVILGDCFDSVQLDIGGALGGRRIVEELVSVATTT